MRRMSCKNRCGVGRVKTICTSVYGERADDWVNRNFKVNRPNALWVSDSRFHHLATWRRFAYTPYMDSRIYIQIITHPRGVHIRLHILISYTCRSKKSATNRFWGVDHSLTKSRGISCTTIPIMSIHDS